MYFEEIKKDTFPELDTNTLLENQSLMRTLFNAIF
jgi:hypothetical protein